MECPETVAKSLDLSRGFSMARSEGFCERPSSSSGELRGSVICAASDVRLRGLKFDSRRTKAAEQASSIRAGLALIVGTRHAVPGPYEKSPPRIYCLGFAAEASGAATEENAV